MVMGRTARTDIVNIGDNSRFWAGDDAGQYSIPASDKGSRGQAVAGMTRWCGDDAVVRG